MNKDDFIKKYRTLIKKYHPDSIQDPVMKEKYEVISKNLNSKYAEYKASNSHVKVARKPAVSTLRLEEHNDYYYKLGYEHYIKIHPSRWVKIDSISELMSGSYTSPNFEIQIQIIKETLSNFASSVENFQYIEPVPKYNNISKFSLSSFSYNKGCIQPEFNQ